MNTPGFLTQVPAALQPLAALGLLLERLERLPRSSASPEQYRTLVQQVQQQLAAATPGAALDALLAALPASAELYENLHYAQAGLCRAPLEAATAAELAVQALLKRSRSLSSH